MQRQGLALRHSSARDNWDPGGFCITFSFSGEISFILNFFLMVMILQVSCYQCARIQACIRDSVTSCIREQLFVTCAQKRQVCVWHWNVIGIRQNYQIRMCTKQKGMQSKFQRPKRSSLGIPCLQIVYLFRMLGRKKTSLIEYKTLCLSTDCSLLHMLQVLE